jgi:hypothetical protein
LKGLDSARTPEDVRRVRGVEVFAEMSMGKPSEGRWVLQDSAGMKLPLSAKKTIKLEGQAD